LAEAPHDILCASVSAMTQLVCNTLTEVFGVRIDLLIDEKAPLIQASLAEVPEQKEEAVQGVLTGFRLQLEDLRETYSDYLSVRTKKK